MNNDNNVNATNTNAAQNPNTSVPVNTGTPTVSTPTNAVANQTTPSSVQTIVVPSSFPEESTTTSATTSVKMPTIVNPLDVKIEVLEMEEKKKPVVEKKEIDDTPKEKGPSEYALKLQQAIDNYKPPSKFKAVSMTLMILLIVLFGLFMPEIYNYVSYIKAGGNKPIAQELTTGVLTCTLETVTSNLDKTFTRKFSYEDNKLKSAVIETSTRGDITLDEDVLDELYNKCVSISKGVDGVSGITVKCEYTEGLLIERERFDYASYDIELIDAAYTEAGSSVVEFDYDSNIDDIKKSMLQAGFTCTKDIK